MQLHSTSDGLFPLTISAPAGSKSASTANATPPAAAQQGFKTGAAAEPGAETLAARLEAAAQEASTAAASSALHPTERATHSRQAQPGDASSTTTGTPTVAGILSGQPRLSIPFVAAPDIPEPPQLPRSAIQCCVHMLRKHAT
jgi:hypothetical protein